MIICPTCGHQVPDAQKFCGNCGSDVRVVATPAPQPAPIYQGAPVNDQQPAPYAYQQAPGASDYGYIPPNTPSPLNRRLILVGAALLLIGCCAFACGLLAGLAVPDILDFFGKGTPAPTPRPTRENMLPILYALGLA